jgi:SprT-like protein
MTTFQKQETKLTMLDLKNHARNFLMDKYGMDLKIPIKRNNRLSRSMGRFIATYSDKPVVIEIAGFTMEYGHPSVIIDTLEHELVHYAMCELNRPYDDEDYEFQKELQKYNISLTETNKVGKYTKYKCEECGAENESGLKPTTLVKNRITSCCRATIIPTGEVVYNGME